MQMSFTARCSLFLVEKKAHALFYRPYPYFAHAGDSEELPGESQIFDIESLIRDGNYGEARFRAKEFVMHTLEGLRFLVT